MSDLVIRSARLEEKADLESLQMAASLMWESDRAALLANPEAGDIPEQQFQDDQVFVAERGGELVGLGVVYLRLDGQAELDGLFTRPDQWRSGIGRALVEEALRRAKAWGATHLYVIGNPNAEAFYLALGFVQFGLEKTEFGVGLRMRRGVKGG